MQAPAMVVTSGKRSNINWREYISSNPDVLFGKAAIIGTCIPVDLILEKLGNGYTVASLLEGYPFLKKRDIQTWLLYAAENARHEKVISAGW